MNDALHNKVVKFFYDYEELFIAIMNKKPYQSDGWDYEIEVVKEFLTANQHCYCGDITNLGVIHRDNGPCHYPENTSEYKRGYADAMNWKTQNHLEHLSTAQPEQEPVAFIDNRIHGFPDCFVNQSEPPHTSPVYLAPPQRKPLTDEDIAELAERMEASDPTDSFWREFARAIEAAHGIKE